MPEWVSALFFVASASVALSPEAKDAITRDLNDPASAQFREVSESAAHPGVFCGEINWRGTAGGYVGFKRFWVDADDGTYAIEPSPGYTVWAAALGC